MASKRKPNSFEIPVDEPKRRHGDTSTDGNNGNAQCTCTCTCGGGSNYRRLESMIEVVGSNCRRLESMVEMVKREFTVARYYQPPRLTSSNEYGGISEGFELRFTTKLQEVYYTQTKISAEGGGPVQIGLFDIGSQCIVRDGAMSCVEVNICVVDGDIGSDIIKWGRENFDANILRPRDGRKALLKGDTTLTLKHGLGVLPKTEFTDNSSWVRTRTFRLAAKSNDPNIREAVTTPFTVQEKRRESCKKHYQPSLEDKVWRLRNIAKGGKIHTQLSLANIEAVRDLMRLYTTNPSKLKQILGNISSDKLEEIIDHAKACAIDDNENYIYETDRCSLVLNSIYEVVRVSFNGQYYASPETLELDHYHMKLLELVKQQAYQNEKDFIRVPLDYPLANPQVGQFGAPHNLVLQQFHTLAPQQGQLYSSGPSTLENGGSEIPFSIYYDPSPTTREVELPDNYSLQFLVNYGVGMSSNGTGKTLWNKIRAALKWFTLRRSLFSID